MRLYPKYKELRARPGGLGDSVEHWLHNINITSHKYIMWKKKYLPWNWARPVENIKCGCDFRKRLLNAVFPYFWRQD